MANQPVNRRDFLRLSLVLAAGSALTACQKQRVLLQLTPTATSEPILNAGILLKGDQFDAWTFVKQVHGSMLNPAACNSVSIRNGTDRTQAVLNEYVFSADVPIHSGTNSLIAVCKHTDEEEELSTEVNITGRLAQRPTAMIDVSLSNRIVILDGKSSLPDELEHIPLKEYVWSARFGNPTIAKVQVSADQDQQDFTREIKGERVELELPAVDGEYYFSLRVNDQMGHEDISATYVVVENGQPRIPDYDHENPVWVEEAIIYGVIPRLFGRPGAKAIQEKLDELADLGVNTMWLAPINATVDYGYSVTDYFELREDFGSKDDFRALVEAAHERGIRVLMDFVPNHTSNEHPYFKDTVEKGENSPYWDFYDRDAQGNYTYYFDWTHLPNLNYNNPEVCRMMIEAFTYWVREFDVDGFRVDACWGVQQRRPDFWPQWRRELKRIKPDLLLLAEASARDPYNFENGFDAAYDWTDQLGRWAWGPFWGEQAPKTDAAHTVADLKQALTNSSDGYHPDALIFRFLNNNDTGTRFISTHGEELTRVATALLLTLPGLPCIYTADEAGQWFRPYFDVTPVSFKERYRGLRDYHKKLIALRKETPSLHSRLWQLLDVKPSDQVLGYIRYLEGKQQPVLILLNFSAVPAQVLLSLPEDFSNLADASMRDLLNDENIAAGKINIPAYGARILTTA